ncbi:lipoprotein-releasing ABC transporter permease subunit, partial [bacterium]|nr:lipoprotein-releasing ABC transporter permease subunit [bacterium]
SIVSLIAILGVALGVAALIVVLAVMTGMEEGIRDQILGTRSHIVISKFYSFDSRGMVPDEKLYHQILSVKGVKGIAPFILGQVMIKAEGVQGILIRGIDPEMEKNVSVLRDNIISGSLDSLMSNASGDGENGILLGYELANMIGADRIGDEVKIISPYNMKTTPFGETPQMRKFKVVGIFKSGYYEYDTSLGYINIKTAQSFFSLGDRINGIEVKIENIFQAKKISDEIIERIGYEYQATDWMEMNRNFFSAMKLEKWAMFIVLLFLIIIAAFSIITTLIMMVMEKNRDIGILRSMGASKKTIMQIFIFEGLIIGLVGTLIGLILGVSICYVCDTYKLISLPADVYTITHLPFKMVLSEVVIIVISSMIICFLATIYPSLQASRLDPVEALRYE